MNNLGSILAAAGVVQSLLESCPSVAIATQHLVTVAASFFSAAFHLGFDLQSDRAHTHMAEHARISHANLIALGSHVCRRVGSTCA
jgi:hypothetical protein